MLDVAGALLVIGQLCVRREACVGLRARLFGSGTSGTTPAIFLSVVSVAICGLLVFAVARPAVAASRCEWPGIFEC